MEQKKGPVLLRPVSRVILGLRYGGGF